MRYREREKEREREKKCLPSNVLSFNISQKRETHFRKYSQFVISKRLAHILNAKLLETIMLEIMNVRNAGN